MLGRKDGSQSKDILSQCLIVLLVGCAYGQYGQQARPGYGHSQCVVDNIQKYGDVCIPTLHTVSMHTVYTFSVIFTFFTGL